jgi:hypothetical protein
MLLNLPTLAVADQCQFKEWVRSGTVERREGVSDCDNLLSRNSTGPISLAAYLSQMRGSAFPRINHPEPPCFESEVTRDDRFELDYCVDGHTNLLGHPVESGRRVEIRSLRTGRMIDTINETTRDSVDSRLSYQNGRDFLLVVEGGTKLKVYELKE